MKTFSNDQEQADAILNHMRTRKGTDLLSPARDHHYVREGRGFCLVVLADWASLDGEAGFDMKYCPPPEPDHGGEAFGDLLKMMVERYDPLREAVVVVCVDDGEDGGIATDIIRLNPES